MSGILILTALLVSCKKEKLPTQTSGVAASDTECKDIVFSNGETFDLTVVTGTQYTAPCFNPLNDNEFLYIRINPPGSNPSRELVKYNLQTNVETVLCNTNDLGGLLLVTQPSWGTQNWIVFSVGTGGSGVGFIIRPDGTQLTQFLPSTTHVYKPRFNGSGTKIIGAAVTINNVPYSSKAIHDINGNIVDTFIYAHNNVGWDVPNSLDGNFESSVFTYINHGTTPKEQGIGYILDDTLIEPIYTFQDDGLVDILGLDRFQDRIYYLKSQDGLYVVMENTQTNLLVREMCDTRRIQSMSISKNSGMILIEEVKRTKLDEEGSVDAQSNILLLNPVTGEVTSVLME